MLLRRSHLPPVADRRAIRLHARVTLRELASFLGVAPMTIHRWENGNAVPRRSAAERYARALDTLRSIDDE